MYEVLKIIHLLSLAGAMGMTAANLIMAGYVRGVDSSLRVPFGPLQRSFGAFGVMAVALLWVTGIALLLLRYDLTALGGWVHAKLLLVVILTGLVISVRKMGARAIKEGTPPPVDLMRKMMMGVLITAVAVVISAVFAFN
jgi:uncharacterized membrane protein